MRFILLFSVSLIALVMLMRTLILHDAPEVTEEDLVRQELLQDKQLHADIEKVLAHKDGRSPDSLHPSKIETPYVPAEEDALDPLDLESETNFEQIRSAAPEVQEEYISALRRQLQQESMALRNLERGVDVEDEKAQLQEKIELKQKYIDELRNEQSL